MANSSYILYSGPHCRLCGDAEQVFYSVTNQPLKLVDVTSSLQLKKDYGLRIPVLQRESDASELAWPFNQESLLEFLLDDTPGEQK